MDCQAYFFDAGLRFECQQCGACCTGEPGTVYVAPNEIRPIARTMNMPVNRLIKEFLYPFQDSYSVREDRDGHCFFYDSGCLIYPVRPSQCRSFPFWLDILRNERRWRRTAAECPGIGRGRLYTREEILDVIRQSHREPEGKP